jgi:hypothetical protein
MGGFFEDDDIDQYVIQMEIEQEITNLDRKSKRGGSKPGKTTNINRGFGNGHQQIYNDYFSENLVYPESKFRRRFRMSSRLMKKIIRDVEKHDSKFFSRRPDATDKLGASYLQKTTAAIRMLVYGSSADACDEYTRISEEMARVSLKRFLDDWAALAVILPLITTPD